MVNIKTLLGEFQARHTQWASYRPSWPLPPSTRADKATSPDNSEPDWESILDIVEEIKQKNVSW